MALGRILKKAITTSERINKLSDKYALLFSWLIPFQDDFGLVWASVDKIKWIVVPARKSLNKEDIEKFIDKIVELKLVVIVNVEGKNWLWFVDFNEKQTLKRDRRPFTYLDKEYEWDFYDKISEFQLNKNKDWKHLEDNGFQMEPSGITSKDKLSKDKIKSVFDFWNKQKIIKHSALTSKMKTKIHSSLKEYSSSEICGAIEKYAKVLELGVPEKRQKYWWTHKWTLEDFLARGLTRFVDAPIDDFLKRNQEVNQLTTDKW